MFILSGLIGLIVGILLIIIGILILILLVKMFLLLLPAIIVAAIIYFFTGDLFLTGIAFLIIAAISLIKKL